MKYKVVANMLVRDNNSAYSSGISYQTSVMACCGLASVQNFNSVKFNDWNDKAEWLAGLYNVLWNAGQVIYCLTDRQLKCEAHQALLEIGAQQLGEFPNIAHGPSMLHMFRVNIRNAAGRFCNKYGEAYASEKSVDSKDIIPDHVTALDLNKVMPSKPIKPRTA